MKAEYRVWHGSKTHSGDLSNVMFNIKRTFSIFDTEGDTMFDKGSHDPMVVTLIKVDTRENASGDLTCVKTSTEIPANKVWDTLEIWADRVLKGYGSVAKGPFCANLRITLGEKFDDGHWVELSWKNISSTVLISHKVSDSVFAAACSPDMD